MAPWNNNGAPMPPTGNAYPGGRGANPNAASAAHTEYYVYRDNGPVIGAGLLGYLIGRRHGRKRTERRLKPVQQKLESELKQVKSAASEKINQVRQLASEKLKERQRSQENNRTQQELIAEQERKLKLQLTEQSAFRPEVALAAAGSAMPVATIAMERYPQLSPDFNPSFSPEQPADLGPERSSEQKSKSRQESATDKAEREEREAERLGKIIRGEAITLSRTELEEISEKIAVEGTSLRNIYKSGLISERGLRYIVSEYLQGHDIKRAVTNEIVEKQRDFERDPILRDHGGALALQGASKDGDSAAASNGVATSAGQGGNGSSPQDQSTPSSDQAPTQKPKGYYNNYNPIKSYRQHAGPDIVVAGGVVLLIIIIIAILLVGFFG
jgi:hypothetical protein